MVAVEASTSKRSSRDDILAATIRLFSERGYTSTSMRDIGHAVGLLPGSLYVHISGKEQLLGDIVESGIDRFAEACGAALQQEREAGPRLRAAVRAHMRIIGESAEHVRVALHQWKYLSGERRDVVVSKRRGYEEIFRRIVEDGIRNGELDAALNARIAVLSIIGTLNWTSEWFDGEGPESADQVADAITDILLRGLERAGG
jgi:TetR/AcrR family transcriptional regulator, cholesterol catabolism regulator